MGGAGADAPGTSATDALHTAAAPSKEAAAWLLVATNQKNWTPSMARTAGDASFSELYPSCTARSVSSRLDTDSSPMVRVILELGTMLRRGRGFIST